MVVNWEKIVISQLKPSRGSLEDAKQVVGRVIVERHDRPSLVSRIACEIGAEIASNIQVPGDDLNSVELACRYNTSRTPVREALNGIGLQRP